MTTTTSRTMAAERVSGRLLIGFTYVSVGFLVIGVVLMIANGISPLDTAPSLDPGSLAASFVALDPVAFLWLGLLLVIAAPIARVIVAGTAYVIDSEWVMAGISIAILLVIVIGVATALTVKV